MDGQVEAEGERTLVYGRGKGVVHHRDESPAGGHGGGAFVRVVARAYAEKNDGLRKFLSDHYGHVLREFGKAISGCVPGLSKEELYWRLDFLAGALTYAMADFGLIKRPSNVTEAAHRERAANELIRFAEAGILAGH